jgi:hypothetical protein
MQKLIIDLHNLHNLHPRRQQRQILQLDHHLDRCYYNNHRVSGSGEILLGLAQMMKGMGDRFRSRLTMRWKQNWMAFNSICHHVGERSGELLNSCGADYSQIATKRGRKHRSVSMKRDEFAWSRYQEEGCVMCCKCGKGEIPTRWAGDSQSSLCCLRLGASLGLLGRILSSVGGVGVKRCCRGMLGRSGGVESW